MNASDRRLVFRLGFVPSLHERPNHLAIREPEREERHRRCVALPEVASPKKNSFVERHRGG